MRKRVWKAIRELNYHPNLQARGLVSGRSRLLGLIVSEVTDRCSLELILGFEDVAVENGYEILIGSINDGAERLQRCILRMAQRDVEGIAVMTFGVEESVLNELEGRLAPLVLIDHATDRTDVSVLRVDYHHGIRQGVQHLAVLGHRDFAFVAGPLRLHSEQSRLAAFRESLQECGIPIVETRIIESDLTMQGGMTAALRLRDCGRPPTAIMCSNDVLAIGILHGLSGTNLRVPDDISIIGFDDTHMAQMTIPPLTSIQVARREIARAAICALRVHIEHSSPKHRYEIATNLIVRESTSFPRGTMPFFLHQKLRRQCTGTPIDGA
jgi:LacI family transcriptional regulator